LRQTGTDMYMDKKNFPRVHRVYASDPTKNRRHISVMYIDYVASMKNENEKRWVGWGTRLPESGYHAALHMLPRYSPSKVMKTDGMLRHQSAYLFREQSARSWIGYLNLRTMRQQVACVCKHTAVRATWNPGRKGQIAIRIPSALEIACEGRDARSERRTWLFSRTYFFFRTYCSRTCGLSSKIWRETNSTGFARNGSWFQTDARAPEKFSFAKTTVYSVEVKKKKKIEADT
jgi:hypothetical protein